MATYKRNVTKEIKTISRERVGRVKAGKVIKSKKDKPPKYIVKTEYDEMGLNDPNFWETF